MNRSWGWIVAVSLVVAYLGVIGPLDYSEELVREAENKELRAQLEAARKPQASPSPPDARIWSKKCAKLGKQVAAWQVDGGPWNVRCVNADGSK